MSWGILKRHRDAVSRRVAVSSKRFAADCPTRVGSTGGPLPACRRWRTGRAPAGARPRASDEACQRTVQAISRAWCQERLRSAPKRVANPQRLIGKGLHQRGRISGGLFSRNGRWVTGLSTFPCQAFRDSTSVDRPRWQANLDVPLPRPETLSRLGGVSRCGSPKDSSRTRAKIRPPLQANNCRLSNFRLHAAAAGSGP